MANGSVHASPMISPCNAAHLPLDVHAEVGNNVLLAKRLGARIDGTFGKIGVLASFEEATDIGSMAGRLAGAGCAEPLIWSFGDGDVGRIAVITGRGCSELDAAVDAGADCFVTGEPVHEAYHAARDHGIHCLFGGHYATETFGVRAIGDLAGKTVQHRGGLDRTSHWNLIEL